MCIGNRHRSILAGAQRKPLALRDLNLHELAFSGEMLNAIGSGHLPMPPPSISEFVRERIQRSLIAFAGKSRNWGRECSRVCISKTVELAPLGGACDAEINSFLIIGKRRDLCECNGSNLATTFASHLCTFIVNMPMVADVTTRISMNVWRRKLVKSRHSGVALRQRKLASWVQKRANALFQPRQVLKFAFPDDKWAPFFLLQRINNRNIAFTVAADLCAPILSIGLRHAIPTWAIVAMPKAAMHEDYTAPCCKNEVWLSRKVLAVKPITETESMNEPSDFHLRPGIA